MEILYKRKVIRDFISLYNEKYWSQLITHVLEYGIILFKKKYTISSLSAEDICSIVENFKKEENIYDKPKKIVKKSGTGSRTNSKSKGKYSFSGNTSKNKDRKKSSSISKNIYGTTGKLSRNNSKSNSIRGDSKSKLNTLNNSLNKNKRNSQTPGRKGDFKFQSHFGNKHQLTQTNNFANISILTNSSSINNQSFLSGISDVKSNPKQKMNTTLNNTLNKKNSFGNNKNYGEQLDQGIQMPKSKRTNSKTNNNQRMNNLSNLGDNPNNIMQNAALVNAWNFNPEQGNNVNKPGKIGIKNKPTICINTNNGPMDIPLNKILNQNNLPPTGAQGDEQLIHFDNNNQAKKKTTKPKAESRIKALIEKDKQKYLQQKNMNKMDNMSNNLEENMDNNNLGNNLGKTINNMINIQSNTGNQMMNINPSLTGTLKMNPLTGIDNSTNNVESINNYNNPITRGDKFSFGSINLNNMNMDMNNQSNIGKMNNQNLMYSNNPQNDYSNLPLYKNIQDNSDLQSGGNLFSQPSEKGLESNTKGKDSLLNFPAPLMSENVNLTTNENLTNSNIKSNNSGIKSNLIKCPQISNLKLDTGVNYTKNFKDLDLSSPKNENSEANEKLDEVSKNENLIISLEDRLNGLNMKLSKLNATVNKNTNNNIKYSYLNNLNKPNLGESESSGAQTPTSGVATGLNLNISGLNMMNLNMKNMNNLVNMGGLNNLDNLKMGRTGMNNMNIEESNSPFTPNDVDKDYMGIDNMHLGLNSGRNADYYVENMNNTGGTIDEDKMDNLEERCFRKDNI